MEIATRFILSFLFVILFSFIEIESLEEFTAKEFANSGKNQGWYYTNIFDSHSVYVPLKNGSGDLSKINTICTFQPVFFGILPFIISRKIIQSFFAVAFFAILTVSTNVIRFHLRTFLMNLNLSPEVSDSISLISGTMVVLSLLIFYAILFIFNHPKTTQK